MTPVVARDEQNLSMESRSRVGRQREGNSRDVFPRLRFILGRSWSPFPLPRRTGFISLSQTSPWVAASSL